MNWSGRSRPLAEEAFTGEFAKLVEHLTERLSGDENGQPKTFRDTAITNLVEFFDKFRFMSLRSNSQLDGLVAEAQNIVRGISPDSLRGSDDLRRQVHQPKRGDRNHRRYAHRPPSSPTGSPPSH